MITLAKRAVFAALGAGVAIAAASLTAGAASASTGSADFTAQAKNAGLSSAKAKELQSRVDRYLTDYHGTQIAANKISADGMYITLALPGEKYARTLPPAAGMRPLDEWRDRCLDGSPVHSGWFCLYKQPVFQGDVLSMYTCGNHPIYNWLGRGSWVNDQTQGTVALLRSNSWSYAYYTPGAYSSDTDYDWTPVDVVHPC
jgi:hypothetical protein